VNSRLQIFLLFGVSLGVGASTWMWFHELHKMVYAVSVLLGISSTILLVVSLSLIADMINKNTVTNPSLQYIASFKMMETKSGEQCLCLWLNELC